MKAEETKVISMLFCITARIWSFVYPKRITKTFEFAASAIYQINKGITQLSEACLATILEKIWTPSLK
jgi:hypothetical protein